MPIDMAYATCKTRGVVMEEREHQHICEQCKKTFTSTCPFANTCPDKECLIARKRKARQRHADKEKRIRAEARAARLEAKNASA